MTTYEGDQLTARMYGADNVAKYKINKRDGPKEAKRRFLAKYPYAIVDKFMFGSYNVMYIIRTDPTRVVNIKSKEFLDNAEYRAALKEDVQWEPLWDVKGTLQPFKKNTAGAGFDMLKFRIYVDKDRFFDSNFDMFVIGGLDVISSDLEPNTYTTALTAAYIATYGCGICTKHFEYNDKTPKIVTSLARYHLYYTIGRVLRSPNKMKRYVTIDISALIQRNKPVRYNWVHDFHQGKEDPGTWERTKPPGTVRNVRPMIKKGFGQIGLNYERRTNPTNKGGYNDFQLFIATESSGLTKTGQLLFQQSIESYVYSVLGAQASTRWAIVGRGAMSLQTQSVFYQKVKDMIIQSDETVAISNMKKAIADTNVVLNLAVTPGVILVPSSMIILTKKVPGYNNVLTTATKTMRFGLNDNVNRSEDPQDTSTVVQRQAEQQPTTTTHSHSDPPKHVFSENPYAGSTVVSLGMLSPVLGVMVARYLV